MARFTAYVQTNSSYSSKVERPFEVPDDELSFCDTEEERDKLITSYAHDAIADDYEWGWTEGDV